MASEQEFALDPDWLDSYPSQAAQWEAMAPAYSETDWDLGWSMTSGAAYEQPSRFVVQYDNWEDPEFRESRMGFLWSVHGSEGVSEVLRPFGVSLLIGWLSQGLNQRNNPGDPWAFRALVRVPIFRSWLEDRMNYACYLQESVTNEPAVKWVVHQQVAFRVWFDLNAVARLQYNEWEEENRLTPLWGGLIYVAEF